MGRLIGHDSRTQRGHGLQGEMHNRMNNKTEEGRRGDSSLKKWHGCVFPDKEMLTGREGQMGTQGRASNVGIVKEGSRSMVFGVEV